MDSGETGEGAWSPTSYRRVARGSRKPQAAGRCDFWGDYRVRALISEAGMGDVLLGPFPGHAICGR
jgi:hypothetical protein